MEIPEGHKELLQAILRELALARDPEVTFTAPVAPVEPEAEPAAIGR